MENKVDIYKDDQFQVGIIQIDEDELQNNGYIKLPKNTFEYINMMLQNFSGDIEYKVIEKSSKAIIDNLTNNAYRLKLEKGLYLGVSKNNKGAFKGLAFSYKHNGIRSQADWVPINYNGDIIPGHLKVGFEAFNVLSFATGCYFLSQINSKLSNLENGISNLFSYLENEKLSETYANHYTLMHINRNIAYIMQNSLEAQSVSHQLKQIKKDALKNMLFYGMNSEKTINKLLLFSNKNDMLDQSIKALKNDLLRYYFSLNNYAYAELLNTVITEMANPNYMNNTMEDIKNKVEEYEKRIDMVENELNIYTNNFKGYNKKNIIPKRAKKLIKAIPVSGSVAYGLKGIGMLASELDDMNVRVANNKRCKAKSKQQNVISTLKKHENLSDVLDLLKDYKEVYNSPIELICSKNNAYMKIVTE